jgi:dihydrofolate synthase/folylpolyglutamate synthase
MEAVSEQCGRPHEAYRTIHVAGTNGKGSVCHLLAAILQQAGYRVGLYTSPHLRDFCERIRVNGQKIPQDAVAAFVIRHRSLFEQLEASFFEIATALAFDWFREEKVDVAIIETGLGGRLDSTNIITPVLSVITSVDYDHTDILGDDILAIAFEKAGIIKTGVPVVLGHSIERGHNGVFKHLLKWAEECAAPAYPAWQDGFILRFHTRFDTALAADGSACITGASSRLRMRSYGRTVTPLIGEVQRANASTVLKALQLLTEQGFHFSPEDVRAGFADVCRLTGLEGRWQQLGTLPLVVCDSGHNPAAWKQITKQITAYNRHRPFRHLHFVLGFSADKDIDAILPYLPCGYANATFYFTQADTPRALPAAALKERVLHFLSLSSSPSLSLSGECYDSVADAVRQACSAASATDFVFIGGSFYVVAEALPLFP